jgi:hypothetical protein
MASVQSNEIVAKELDKQRAVPIGFTAIRERVDNGLIFASAISCASIRIGSDGIGLNI